MVQDGVACTYTYGDTEWKDLITSYNGETITYDPIGNPLSYRGKTLAWTGRRLDSLTQNGSTNTYLYNADGIRTQKTVNGTATEYFLNGSTILAEKTGDIVIWFIYDDSGDVLGLIHNGTAYYYLKNQQGDVLKIVDGSGNVVGSYTYDAWGKVLSATGEMAQANPIRYRSYYYDADTGLYYLQSRYYDPEIGRFISADDTQYLGASGTALGYNLFGYCENNPVNYSDANGNFVIRRWMIATPIDIVLSMIPGIGAAFAPIKSIAKAYSKAALKAKIKTPLVRFIQFVAKNSVRILTAIKKALGQLWSVGRWLASKIPVNKLATMLAGAASSMIINKFLNLILPNIDIVLSVGGAISGILDYVFDKRLNNSIWVI